MAASPAINAPARSVAQPTRNKPTLKRIKKPVEKELALFQKHFKRSINSPIGLLDRVIRYLLRQKGKQIRPLLVLLAAKTCGEISDKSYRGAALVELMHTATLIHDDVVDDADHRRGMFSINALWKNKIAVLLGDFLLSRGLLLALDHQDYKSLHILSDAVKRMSEGELLQLQKARLLDIDEATYFNIISDKTASLTAACTACGAASVSDDDEVVAKMKEVGEKLGIAFQIRDDLFDYGIKDVGKPLGIDLQEKKMTLPLIHALNQAQPADHKRIMRIVRKKKKDKNDIREVSVFVTDLGGIAYARDKMDSYAEEARNILFEFAASPARDALLDLVDFTILREK